MTLLLNWVSMSMKSKQWNGTGTTIESNINLIERYEGEGWLFPGAPKCIYKGKVIPGYVAFSPSGGITATILTNIFRRLDYLQVLMKSGQLE